MWFLNADEDHANRSFDVPTPPFLKDDVVGNSNWETISHQGEHLRMNICFNTTRNDYLNQGSGVDSTFTPTVAPINARSLHSNDTNDKVTTKDEEYNKAIKVGSNGSNDVLGRPSMPNDGCNEEALNGNPLKSFHKLI